MPLSRLRKNQKNCKKLENLTNLRFFASMIAPKKCNIFVITFNIIEIIMLTNLKDVTKK